jgi:hypothetical protein
MSNPKEPAMNDAPRSYLTPADRDAAMIEASRLHAMTLRREAVDAFWAAIGRAVRAAAASLTRTVFHSRKEA